MEGGIREASGILSLDQKPLASVCENSWISAVICDVCYSTAMLYLNSKKAGLAIFLSF